MGSFSFNLRGRGVSPFCDQPTRGMRFPLPPNICNVYTIVVHIPIGRIANIVANILFVLYIGGHRQVWYNTTILKEMRSF